MAGPSGRPVTITQGRDLNSSLVVRAVKTYLYIAYEG